MMKDEGWKAWPDGSVIMEEPPYGVPLLIRRDEWPGSSFVCKREDISPYTNRVGLYWKLSGIAQEVKP